MIRYQSYSVTAACLLFFLQCASFDPRGGGAPGTDYFDSDFACSDSTLLGDAERTIFRERYVPFTQVLAAENQQIGQARFVIAGDSIAALFTPDRLNRFLTGIPIVNRGIGGDSTTLLLNRLDDTVLSLRPQVLIISIGGNDLLAGRCIPAIIENTRAIIEKIKATSPGTRVYFVSVPPIISWKGNSIIPFYNQLLRYLTNEYSNVHYFDLWEFLAARDAPRLQERFHFYFPDGKLDRIHFNDEGYKEWGQRLRPLLR